LEGYHFSITEEEHTKILNSMPYKKSELKEFGDYIEKTISEHIGIKVKVFNDDIWFRICRPSHKYSTDFNPCHRDTYLNFYRNTVNIYLPICSSNENSSLTIEPGSHYWNENETIVTNGGAYFKSTNKKYSVDAIVASKQKLNMIRPNPQIGQVMLFSPYLIHGCANNNNLYTTRISIEVRFIQERFLKQEEEFNAFLKNRIWR
jgi:ectoine hydroxylase-related dioxygenase (phytanoyl-CoA dioxygenase family)